MSAELKSWRVVFLLERRNPRFRPLPLPLSVQATTAEGAKDRAEAILARVKTGRPVVSCFVTEGRA